MVPQAARCRRRSLAGAQGGPVHCPSGDLSVRIVLWGDSPSGRPFTHDNVRPHLVSEHALPPSPAVPRRPSVPTSASRPGRLPAAPRPAQTPADALK